MGGGGGGRTHTTAEQTLTSPIMQNSWRVTCLLLVATGSWIHTDVQRCSWYEAHDANKLW